VKSELGPLTVVQGPSSFVEVGIWGIEANTAISLQMTGNNAGQLICAGGAGGDGDGGLLL